MARERILVVEDEQEIQELLRYTLAKEGYQLVLAGSVAEARDAVRKSPPDLVLLDLMLPDQDGLDLCRTLRRESATQGVPVIMLTAKGEDSDIVSGLELGADDYVTKPFSPRVLLARIRAVLRRKDPEPETEDGVIRLHEMEIDPRRHQVSVAGDVTALTATEFRVLMVLAQRPGWVFTRSQIARSVHGDDVVTDRAIDVQIVGLRRKLGSAGQYIETIRGVGYRLRA
ncbi:MAG: response regulator transcription factor [Planctomycetota bacterium]